ncbi:Protein kinase, catalytic domain-containing protein [Rozella allomycis CSF55]|uniref:mitogen-activated protein kinase kinase n=1 Tax=Rozella allomycis (strain CSF55) TaxID=988480 RepID=A0A075AX24_ROZAC|nr:Protein kinase, catalytic domain-containing protein [Rozella allomycis CSF55]|eukprot:EPZ34684.1 Protein kinase, catalytic domain-containing protein [Rozella allomycis CSF55]
MRLMHTKRPAFRLSDLKPKSIAQTNQNSDFENFMDSTGHLVVPDTAVLNDHGVEFTNGETYDLNSHEIDILDEIGRGQFGSVFKVFHRSTVKLMALKKIKLQLTESGMKQILMELDVLHRSRSDFIIEFYGAYFSESSVSICMELMDIGSIDRIYANPINEHCLGIVAGSVVRGLEFLKVNLSIIHRDVKPTNILANSRGDIKLCDFGVSGKLIRSLAKTNIGCQSYMAPERITSGDMKPYKSISDVWSLGVSLLEIGLGRYPFPLSRKDSVFAQITAIVKGDPPTLPTDRFSTECSNFIELCLNKDPEMRPSYSQLLAHPFLLKHPITKPDMEMISWINKAKKL